MDPHQYPRRVLVCATGLSPQVVTETIYALAVQHAPTFVPTEVQIITTAEGAHRARLMLLEGKAGQFQQFCQAYGLQGITFGKDNIHVICARDGKPLDDIVDADANAACADAMVRMIADISRDKDSALHVSIAGGRKTMGYLLGYALTLFGREQDRLSHVLVSSPYESNPGFYFPTRESHILHTRDGRPIDASEAKVQLVSIPYVSLRSGLAGQLANSELTFSDAVHKAALTYGPVPIEVNIAQRTLHLGDASVGLPPRSFCVWLWLWRLAQQGEPGLPRYKFGIDPTWRERFRHAIATEAALGDRVQTDIDDLWSIEPGRSEPNSVIHTDGSKWLGERVNEINSRIRRVLGELGVERMGVVKYGKPTALVYRLSADPASVSAR